MNATPNMTPEDGRYLAEITERIRSLPEDKLTDAAKWLKWGTFGITGDQPMKVRYLADLDTDHLQNIIITQDGCPWLYRKVILHLLKQRWTESACLKLQE